MTDRRVRLPSGREVGMTGLGDPAGERLAVLLHPTPGASGFDPAPQLTARSGIHLLTFERPGYGVSAPESVSVSDWVDDLAGYLRRAEGVARSAASTDYGRIGVVGWREGGIYAAALASRHPNLVERLVLVGAPSPSRASAAPHPRPVDAAGNAAAGSVPAGFAPAGFGDRVERMLRTADEQGDAGVAADRRAFGAPDVPQPSADVPTLILYGSSDDCATVHDARWYSAGLPNARVERVDGGSDIIGRQWEHVLRFLNGPAE